MNSPLACPLMVGHGIADLSSLLPPTSGNRSRPASYHESALQAGHILVPPSLGHLFGVSHPNLKAKQNTTNVTSALPPGLNPPWVLHSDSSPFFCKMLTLGGHLTAILPWSGSLQSLPRLRITLLPLCRGLHTTLQRLAGGPRPTLYIGSSPGTQSEQPRSARSDIASLDSILPLTFLLDFTPAPSCPSPQRSGS